jgi:pilus assembly protein CpaB
VTVRQRRRRAAAVLAIALACGGLAASEVSTRTADVEQRIGPPVPVVVAARDLDAGTELRRRDMRVASFPSRYAPRDAPPAPEQAIGLTTAGPVAAGSPITAGVVGAADVGSGPAALRKGERAVEVAVTAGATLAETAAPGTRVDVLVSTEPADGPARSLLALEDVELLGFQPAAAGEDLLTGDPEAGAGTPTALATLRVTLRQALYLTAAQNYGREIRLLPRPTGDRNRLGRAAVLANQL